MTETPKYYKAVRPYGTDFHTGKINYLAGGVITHPRPGKTGDTSASGYFSVSDAAANCTSFAWPARLLLVDLVGESWSPDAVGLPNKRAVHGLTVIEELPAYLLFGPQGEQMVTLFEGIGAVSGEQIDQLYAAWGAAWDAALGAARGAAFGAARGAAWGAAWDAALGAARGAAFGAAWDAAFGAAWDAAFGAARGLLVRDLISPERYDALTGPWRKVIGRIHPDDADLS